VTPEGTIITHRLFHLTFSKFDAIVTLQMKLKIIGDGAFGSFMKELLAPHFELSNDADSVMLAVPISAYDSVASANYGKHLINVCSVQKPSTDICLRYSERVTSIHPLFGRRTPEGKRNSILTYKFTADNDTWLSQAETEFNFLNLFVKVSSILQANGTKKFTPESHDILMAKTHVAALMGAQQLKVWTERAKDIPDELIPNSFRLMREFVKTLEDMPQGTVESIMANPYV
jgi:prephenate dehydrogenase